MEGNMAVDFMDRLLPVGLGQAQVCDSIKLRYPFYLQPKQQASY